GRPGSEARPAHPEARHRRIALRFTVADLPSDDRAQQGPPLEQPRCLAMNTLLDSIADSLRLTWAQIQVISPRLLGAIIFLSLGWLLARAARWLVVRLLRLLRVDALSERIGL